MKIILPILAASHYSGGRVSEVVFWVLLVLCAVGAFFVPDSQPYSHRGWFFFCLLLIAILGWHAFGTPN